ncbi:hypothetical protein G7Y89_g1353 [Cudoniella acicularis]|uniref:DUF726-domain-containing protein n=1 Tax=Cudoniella acicularis TaxID=354080 RepID=A0A8H4W9L9_9HELO|nr:hypothetical protein G7Y89_g1353 [Cudoniella acicularis]
MAPAKVQDDSNRTQDDLSTILTTEEQVGKDVKEEVETAASTSSKQDGEPSTETKVIPEHEVKVAQGLLEAAKNMSGKEEAQKRSNDNKFSRRWKVGLAGVAGAAVIGVTGGLAAPLVAGAISTELCLLCDASNGRFGPGATTAAGLLGALAESGIIVGSLFGAYGGCMTGQMMDAYAKEVDDFAFLPLKGSRQHEPKPEDRILRVTIGKTWNLDGISISKVVDNPFSVAKNRADKAGIVLADALINKAQGERLVTLIGYSLSARLIYNCLMSLAERRAFGLIESAVLMGSRCPSDAAPWRAMRTVVSSRLVNCYSENDYILAFLYRTSSIQYGVAGLQEVQDVKGVENVNVSDIVSGHLRLQYLVGSILEKIGFEDIDVVEVEKEETLALLEKEEEKEQEAKEGGNVNLDEEAEKMEVGQAED